MTPDEHLTAEAKAGVEKVRAALKELMVFLNKQTEGWSSIDRVRYTSTILQNHAVRLTKDCGVPAKYVMMMAEQAIEAGSCAPPVFSPQDLKPEHKPQ